MKNRTTTALGEFINLTEKLGREPKIKEWLEMTDFVKDSYYKAKKAYKREENEV